MAGTWSAENGILIYSPDGNLKIIPSAAEIYGMVFEGWHEFRGQDLSSGFVNLPRDLDFSRYPIDIKIGLGVKPASGSLYLNLLTVVNDQELEITDFFSSDADHRVINGVWYPFVRGVRDEILSIVHSAQIHSAGEISLSQYIHLLKSTFQTGTVIDKTANRMHAASISALHPYTESNLCFTGKLYPYQEMGVGWLKWVSDQGVGCILADEMGLGKTIQLIALLALQNSPVPSLIIAPATIMENWRREFEKFSTGLNILVHHGTSRTGFPATFNEFHAVITSYGTAVRDGLLMKMIPWNLIILDEAQAIKNPRAQRTGTIKGFHRRIGIAVSGTPLQNHISDLWSVMDFSVPGLLGTQSYFERRYADDIDSANLVEPLVSPVILRRTVDEVARDLPEKIEIPQTLVLDGQQADEYEQVRIETMGEYGASGMLVALTRLRMFCTHPFLLDDSSGDPAVRSPKYARLIEILEEIFENGRKALVFTSYNRMVDMMLDDIPFRFGMPGLFSGSITGATPITERQPLIDEFNNHSGAGYLVLNPVAGGTGLNITGANHVIIYNLEWNPAIEEQAVARAYRRGQTRPVTVHRMFYVDTVEEVMNDRLEYKRELARSAVVGTHGKTRDVKDIMRAIKISPLAKREGINTDV